MFEQIQSFCSGKSLFVKNALPWGKRSGKYPLKSLHPLSIESAPPLIGIVGWSSHLCHFVGPRLPARHSHCGPVRLVPLGPPHSPR